jgi:hypothetical protein
MSTYLILSGVIAAATVAGHFIIGQKQFLQPMLSVEFEPVAKNVLHCVFHYVSVFLVLSAIALFLSGFSYIAAESAKVLCAFLGLNYLSFAIWQILIALKSGLQQPLFKLFQWVFFVLIGGFALLGAAAL